MSDAALYSLLALLLAVLGFAWLALALPNHWRQVHGSLPLTAPRQAILRSGASLMLGLSLLCSLAGDSPAMAILLWLMLLSSAIVVVACLLACQPRWLHTITLLTLLAFAGLIIAGVVGLKMAG
ncbi:hypothetical protein CFY91_09355 [Pseudomonas fluvialis]|jgi:hypothetical protein|uniref:DUF3325 domain-containing protein n=1 Tax=Pseudomonas fluvialis TaxID=1793966 RepID=A0ABQ2AUC0_9PSED|nr:DUF3325 domain-containing protein [Pseudomonas fluvialis]OXM40312.1 hypothetical protein CFY91_09355 [Pseudomonas fluvialis]GGH96129.1 hypothetical protein GCM10007363_26990 [Pseudomonas fluvialis]